jgi:hypothetical protein
MFSSTLCQELTLLVSKYNSNTSINYLKTLTRPITKTLCQSQAVVANTGFDDVGEW